MGKRKKKNGQKKICNNCIKYQTSDKPNRLANVGFRVIYTAIAWLWLGVGLVEGNTFFVSLGLFIIPLLMEYISFKPEETWRKKLRNVQLFFCWIYLGIAFLGGIGGLEIVKSGNHLIVQTTDAHILLKEWNRTISLQIVYSIGMIFIFLTGIDWIASPRNIETDYRNVATQAN